MNLISPPRLWITALLLALCFDQLFWEQAPGISFPIFMFLLLAAGVWLARREGHPPARPVWVLLVLAVVLALASALRIEPLTQALSVLLALVALILAAMSWAGGKWWAYNLVDILVNGLRLVFMGLGAPMTSLNRPKPDASPARGRIASLRPLISVLFGLLLALPVVALLASLLAQADLVFAQRLQSLLDLLRIENLAEYLFRLTYVLIGAYLIVGGLLYAFWHSSSETLADPEKPRLPPVLGWIEASTVLASVNLLFGFFVLIQVQYFFGGRANIHLDGFTYAEYARRGFGELVIVAALSLALFLGLGALTRRSELRAGRTFSGLGILLVLLVGLMLVSAFQRLALYEQAYGFTRLRTYTFVFMFWLGLLLLVTVLLELRGRLRHFALAALVASLGFSISLGLLNVDAFIARQNIARAANGEQNFSDDQDRASFDSNYLAGLSDDAVPVLFASLGDAQLPEAVRQEIGAALVCRRLGANPRPSSWPSWHFASARAARLYAANQAAIAGYNTWLQAGAWYVVVNGQPRPCQASAWID